MAATDQTYRSQKALDVVFGVTCVLMLLSIIWMFWQDYDREWKKEQRVFRDVEEAMAERGALAKLPSAADFRRARKSVADAEKLLASRQKDLDDNQTRMDNLRAPIVKADNYARAVKADLDSARSLYDIEVEKGGPDSSGAQQYRKSVDELTVKYGEAQDKVDKLKKENEDLLRKKDEIERPKKLADARLKKLTDDYNIQYKLAEAKRWRTNDWFRSLPIIDAFNSPLRIQQITLNDLPIDYNFKYVTRFDRCMTCHQGIDRPAYEKDALRALKNPAGGHPKGLGDLTEKLPNTTVDLSEARVTEFCVHPRLDLFVGPNSPHSAEKFGCTICHGGQGSATDFFYASHSPNTMKAQRGWNKEFGWKNNHDWEYPMWPARFVEASCLKCHHQVTDLIREGNRNEAPKLVRGYNLVRENGCFGCHEFSAIKSGTVVGPDLRLEPNPPLEEMSPEERVQFTADPLNPPGTMRKVGPSLYRLSEKTHADWVRHWIKSPRTFRPTTRMPHFYGLSNNNPHVLKEEEGKRDVKTGQEAFPDAEIDAITHYLFYESTAYLHNIDTARKEDYLKLAKKFDAARTNLAALKKDGPLTEEQTRFLDELTANADDRTQLEKLLQEKMPHNAQKREAWLAGYVKKLAELEKKLDLVGKTDDLARFGALNDIDAKLVRTLAGRLKQRGQPVTLAEKFKQSQGKAQLPAQATDEQVKNGRRLFSEKGCLACHSHKGVTEPGPGLMPDPNNPGKLRPVTLPAIDREKYYKSDAPFGPNLSALTEKLGTDAAGKDYASKRRWLIQWILDPHFHSPRTLMPVTHLTFEQAAAVAAWLLSQQPGETGAGWDKLKEEKLATSTRTLENLARTNLEKYFSPDEVNKIYRGDFKSIRIEDAGDDEAELIGMINAEDRTTRDALKWYNGKRAIARLGCFGCHNVPGFDYAKPIGTPLNDWGRKDVERLAFEDIRQYVDKHFRIVDSLTDGKGKPVQVKKGEKPPYERFFYEQLAHHNQTRAGFLNQKLREPRSYDYDRLRTWDDRLRMPQFKFARVKRQPDESDAAFQARADLEEAEAREAVMTFVLGLVAEPIPAKFLNDPGPDRLAEVRGRQVIDKYNCASCHLLRSGTFEFKTSPRLLKNLDAVYDRAKEGVKTDYNERFFLEHNAWNVPAPARRDQVIMHGVYQGLPDPEDPDKKVPVIRLTDALRWHAGAQGTRDVRSYNIVQVPLVKGKPADMTVRSPHLGGTFGDLLVPYLIDIYKDQKQFEADPNTGDNSYARASVPPLLDREGEKVQPNWLFQFLRNPSPIRPMAKLRMPRFNMSDEEAHALVNYFASHSKTTNPGIDLTYPYAQVPERDEDFLSRRNRVYVERLKKNKGEYDKRMEEMKPIWRQMLADQVAEQEATVAEARKALAAAKDADKATAQGFLDLATKRLKEIQDQAKKEDYKAQEQEWEAHGAYARDGYKLITNRLLCLNCHQVGNLEASNPEIQRGPPLALAQDRLRPGWVERWVANPQRFLTYPSVMPQYFLPAEPKFQELFLGSSLEQIEAARDVLMNFRKVAEMPAIRTRPAPQPGGK